MKKSWISMTVLATVAGTAAVTSPVAQAGTTSSAASAKQEAFAAAQWMGKTQLKPMHDWSIVTLFADHGALAPSTWTSAEMSQLKSSTDYARFILALLAAGQDPHNYAGKNWVKILASAQLTSGTDAGKFADNVDGTGTDLINAQMWAIIALEDAGGATYQRQAAAQWLIAHQNSDGGFGSSMSYPSSDPDDTAAAMTALHLLGSTVNTPAVAKALAFLKTQQASDGGFAYPDGSGTLVSNSDSTGVTVDALEGLGIDPTTWIQTGGNPVSALLALQDKATGGFDYDGTGGEFSGVNGSSTRDAVFGLTAYVTGQSVFDRLHWQPHDSLNGYWTVAKQHRGAWSHGTWYNWQQVYPMAVAASNLGQLSPYWQHVIGSHGLYQNHKWQSFGPQLAKQALAAAFGWDSIHLMGIS